MYNIERRIIGRRSVVRESGDFVRELLAPDDTPTSIHIVQLGRDMVGEDCPPMLLVDERTGSVRIV